MDLLFFDGLSGASDSESADIRGVKHSLQSFTVCCLILFRTVPPAVQTPVISALLGASMAVQVTNTAAVWLDGSRGRSMILCSRSGRSRRICEIRMARCLSQDQAHPHFSFFFFSSCCWDSDMQRFSLQLQFSTLHQSPIGRDILSLDKCPPGTQHCGFSFHL